MQSSEDMAQGSRHESGPVSTPTDERAASLAVSQSEGRRNGASDGESGQLLVLLLRKENKGAEPVGEHDQTADVREGGDRVRGEAGRTEAGGLPSLTLGELDEPTRVWVQKRRNRHNIKWSPFLHDFEVCFVLRRRKGLKIYEAAELAGISRYWYNSMELGKANPERLINFWVKNEG